VLSPGPTNEGSSLARVAGGGGAVVVGRVELDIERMGKKRAESAVALGIMCGRKQDRWSAVVNICKGSEQMVRWCLGGFS